MKKNSGREEEGIKVDKHGGKGAKEGNDCLTALSLLHSSRIFLESS